MPASGKERVKSKVWDYFSKENDDVTCNICDGKVSQGSSRGATRNTSNLWSHLKAKHKEEYNKAHEDAAVVQEQASTSVTKEPDSRQPTLPEVLDKQIKWSVHDRRTKETTDRGEQGQCRYILCIRFLGFISALYKLLVNFL